MPTTGEQLSDLSSQVQRIVENAKALVQRVGDEQCAKRPSADKWSIAECFGHLNLTLEPYFPIWQQAFQDHSSDTATDGRAYKLDMIGRVFVWLLEPPVRFKFPAPKNFQPQTIHSMHEVLPTFLNNQQRLLQTISNAYGRPIDRIKIESPADRRMKYSIWSSFCLMTAHERRHLWQAERVAIALLGK